MTSAVAPWTLSVSDGLLGQPTFHASSLVTEFD